MNKPPTSSIKEDRSYHKPPTRQVKRYLERHNSLMGINLLKKDGTDLTDSEQLFLQTYYNYYLKNDCKRFKKSQQQIGYLSGDYCRETSNRITKSLVLKGYIHSAFHYMKTCTYNIVRNTAFFIFMALSGNTHPQPNVTLYNEIYINNINNIKNTRFTPRAHALQGSSFSFSKKERDMNSLLTPVLCPNAERASSQSIDFHKRESVIKVFWNKDDTINAIEKYFPTANRDAKILLSQFTSQAIEHAYLKTTKTLKMGIKINKLVPFILSSCSKFSKENYLERNPSITRAYRQQGIKFCEDNALLEIKIISSWHPSHVACDSPPKESQEQLIRERDKLTIAVQTSKINDSFGLGAVMKEFGLKCSQNRDDLLKKKEQSAKKEICLL